MIGKLTVLTGALLILASCTGSPDQGDCPEYLVCAETAGSYSATLDATYGEEGVCWKDQDPTICRAACTDAKAAITTVLGADCAPDAAENACNACNACNGEDTFW
ncbi:MAG: hypothetical protein ACI9VR_000848 [Cognaticolwellia sp.]|jgi:hypothetical protein